MPIKQPRIQQSKEELLSHLKEQLNFLKKSSTDYDKGDISEAKRIAVTLRTLLHDTSNSTSLLKQLNIKHSLQYLDSCLPEHPGNLLSYTGLVSIKVKANTKGITGAYTPFLDNRPTIKTRLLDFETWWTGMLIIKDQKGNQFTRKDLILNVANTDGGAHIDSEIAQPYHSLTRHNSIGMVLVTRNGHSTTSESLLFIELASIRQVGYEFMESISQLKLNY